jgi:alkanesulfonate monooxygenase SsuD/methylene tetrahydromethanopterin reductase-like flavin-dependent oxidoreductase (luciferase family)
VDDFRFVILVVPYMRRRGEKVGLAGSDPSRWTRLVQQVREQMQFAESVGFDGFCMTEQHLQVEGIETTTNPLLWDFFVAQHTERMRIGQLGMNLTVVNPIQLAENLAMLDHFTNGRLFVGFSRGNTPRWTATFGQHIEVMSTESDKSDADQRNRRAFYENWNLVKSLWTQEKVSLKGEFWNAPQPVPWTFPPTADFDPAAVGSDGTLREIGIVPRPLQQPHPPVYAPFSYSMETSKFWAREGGKMVSFVAPEREDFIRLALDIFIEEADRAGRTVTPDDALALGAHLTMGRTSQERADLYRGFEELYNWAYNAPPYVVPMGRVFGGSREQELDHVGRLHDRFGVREFFLWHHVGYFEPDQELAMLNEFAEGVIRPLGRGRGGDAR